MFWDYFLETIETADEDSAAAPSSVAVSSPADPLKGKRFNAGALLNIIDLQRQSLNIAGMQQEGESVMSTCMRNQLRIQQVLLAKAGLRPQSACIDMVPEQAVRLLSQLLHYPFMMLRIRQVKPPLVAPVPGKPGSLPVVPGSNNRLRGDMDVIYSVEDERVHFIDSASGQPIQRKASDLRPSAATANTLGGHIAVIHRADDGSIDFFDSNLGEGHFNHKGDFIAWFREVLVPMYASEMNCYELIPFTLQR